MDDLSPDWSLGTLPIKAVTSAECDTPPCNWAAKPDAVEPRAAGEEVDRDDRCELEPVLFREHLGGGVGVGRAWRRELEVVIERQRLLGAVAHCYYGVERRIGVISLGSVDIVGRGARLVEVEFEHVHVTIAGVPNGREGVGRPTVQLHQDESHGEAVRDDDERVGVLEARPQVDLAHPTLPPRARPAVHIGAALARREAVKEAADALLLGAERLKLVTLQVAKLLLAHARFDLGVDDVGLDRLAQAARRLHRPLKRRDDEEHAVVAQQRLEPVTDSGRLLDAGSRQLDQVVGFCAVQRVVGIALALAVPDQYYTTRQSRKRRLDLRQGRGMPPHQKASEEYAGRRASCRSDSMRGWVGKLGHIVMTVY
eukprot:CAMPEP_0203935368 /NCGR_PEP_ID=MMETSP0359-20131031/73134_1 /ASSEMBLY_ACC=CAM_ASM_000338 /TAXON_ID=268821 /ORGANISM="Scrippsiella Hangoei, Strain SHTV-5" /LENGTH=368 /DNA_ID=CAMNT_0050865205 /DNA_START=135 /DNA_END=1243 /DNA_ORIENTATION=+